MSPRIEIAGDLSHLPDYAFGSASIGWWGVAGFMLIEGMAFALVVGAYLYLLPNNLSWPASSPPGLRYSTLFTLLMIASVLPNAWIARAAKKRDLRASRLGTLVMLGFGIVLLLLRAFQFAELGVHWDRNAYGSIVWAILLIHTVHLATDVYDTAPLVALLYLRRVDGRRFSDVSENALYWNFVAASWLPLYALLYWLPRGL